MIYTAASPSLAVLEILVHLDLTPDLLPSDYRLLAIDVPGDGELERSEATPAHVDACVRVGDDFLRRGRALGLSVPSVIVPQERNLLLNPVHPDASRLKLLWVEPFAFDPRLLS